MTTIFNAGDTVKRIQQLDGNDRRINAAELMPGRIGTVQGRGRAGWCRVSWSCAQNGHFSTLTREARLLHHDAAWCDNTGEYVSDTANANRADIG